MSIKTVQTYNDAARRSAKARDTAAHLIADAARGPAMGTAVEQRLNGLGRAQIAEIVAVLFAELAQHSVRGS